MSRVSLLPRTARICIAVIMIASLTSMASDVSIPGDRDGDGVVSDDELSGAYQDHKNGTISPDEIHQIGLIHDDYPIEVADSAGNVITIYQPLKRVVVLTENPDVIIRTYSNSSYGGYANDDTSMMQKLRESIAERPGCENIAAVENDRVYIPKLFSVFFKLKNIKW